VPLLRLSAELLLAQLLNSPGDPLTPEQRHTVTAEMADVLIHLCRMADVLGADLLEVAARKLVVVGRRYPADEVRGNSAKRP
jgi:hypothetical protein